MQRSIQKYTKYFYHLLLCCHIFCAKTFRSKFLFWLLVADQFSPPLTHLFHIAQLPTLSALSLLASIVILWARVTNNASSNNACPLIPLAHQNSEGPQKEKQNHLLWKILLVLFWSVHTVCPVLCTQTQMKFCFLPVSSCWITTSFPLHLAGREL